MQKDQYGCPLSTKSPDVVNVVNKYSTELLRSGKNMDIIVEAANQYPEEVIIQLYAAMYYLCDPTEESFRQAENYLNIASRSVSYANQREKSLFSVAWHWSNHLLTDALKDIEWHCFKWPKDLTALSIAEALFFYKGLKHESNRLLRLTTQCLGHLLDNPDFLTIHAFALELCGKYIESDEYVHKALSLSEDNPRAHHMLSHYYVNNGQIEKGIEQQEQYATYWKHASRAIESHNLWHLAILYLENLNLEKALEVYQRADWLHQASLVTEQIDATALLWRLDMEDQYNPELWKALAYSIGDNANFAVAPFLSVHLCYALKKGGRLDALQKALDAIAKMTHEQIKEDRYIWREVGLPLLHGTLAFAENDYLQAVRHLEPIISQVACGGGSDVQVDLFYETYLKSLIGIQRYGDAEALIHQKTQGRNLTKREIKWLSECHWEDVSLRRAS